MRYTCCFKDCSYVSRSDSMIFNSFWIFGVNEGTDLTRSRSMFPFLYPLKTTNQRFSDIFRGHRKRHWAWNRLRKIDLTRCSLKKVIAEGKNDYKIYDREWYWLIKILKTRAQMHCNNAFNLFPVTFTLGFVQDISHLCFQPSSPNTQFNENRKSIEIRT